VRTHLDQRELIAPPQKPSTVEFVKRQLEGLQVRTAVRRGALLPRGVRAALAEQHEEALDALERLARVRRRHGLCVEDEQREGKGVGPRCEGGVRRGALRAAEALRRRDERLAQPRVQRLQRGGVAEARKRNGVEQRSLHERRAPVEVACVAFRAQLRARRGCELTGEGRDARPRAGDCPRPQPRARARHGRRIERDRRCGHAGEELRSKPGRPARAVTRAGRHSRRPRRRRWPGRSRRCGHICRRRKGSRRREDGQRPFRARCCRRDVPEPQRICRRRCGCRSGAARRRWMRRCSASSCCRPGRRSDLRGVRSLRHSRDVRRGLLHKRKERIHCGLGRSGQAERVARARRIGRHTKRAARWIAIHFCRPFFFIIAQHVVLPPHVVVLSSVNEAQVPDR
jgi:hypothetical protein